MVLHGETVVFITTAMVATVAEAGTKYQAVPQAAQWWCVTSEVCIKKYTTVET